MNDHDQMKQKDVFPTIAAEASGFYNVIFVTASSFLGGSLLFFERISKNPVPASVWALSVGWLLLIGAIGLVGWIRWKNVESGRARLEGRREDATAIDKLNRLFSILALVFLVLGMAAIAVFGFLNVISKIK